MKMKEEQSINSLLSKDQSQEKKNKKLFESKKYIMFSLIFILLVILSIIVIFSILSSQIIIENYLNIILIQLIYITQMKKK